jgi:hypothetical protein
MIFFLLFLQIQILDGETRRFKNGQEAAAAAQKEEEIGSV